MPIFESHLQQPVFLLKYLQYRKIRIIIIIYDVKSFHTPMQFQIYLCVLWTRNDIVLLLSRTKTAVTRLYFCDIITEMQSSTFPRSTNLFNCHLMTVYYYRLNFSTQISFIVQKFLFIKCETFYTIRISWRIRRYSFSNVWNLM